MGLCKELQALAAIMKTLTKEREFVLRHPEADPVKKRRDQLREERIRKNFDIFIENTSDESIERILRATDRFLELAAENALTAIPERDENGTIRYKVVE